MELWSAAQAAEFLRLKPGAARRQLSRWGVRAATYERGASGRPEARYDAHEVRGKAANRPGRGARTDLAKTIPAEPGPVDYAVLAQIPPVREQAASSVWDQLNVSEPS